MEIKIGDFGISKQFNSNKEYTLTINQKGSPAYIAPEIFKDGKYNKKCDIYSLGCIMYELFTLNIYFIDKISDSIKKIDTNKYNYKWQEVIDSLLQVDYNKRLDIDQICEYIFKEENKINQIGNLVKNMKIRMNIQKYRAKKNNVPKYFEKVFDIKINKYT